MKKHELDCTECKKVKHLNDFATPDLCEECFDGPKKDASMNEAAKMVNELVEKFPGQIMTIDISPMKSVHVEEAAFRREFVGYTVTERDCDQYKYKLSTTIDGIEFLANTNQQEENK